MSNGRLKLVKKSQAKAKQHPEMNFCYLTITCFLHPRYYPKIIGDTLKNLQKNQYDCIHDNKNEGGNEKQITQV